MRGVQSCLLRERLLWMEISAQNQNQRKDGDRQRGKEGRHEKQSKPSKAIWYFSSKHKPFSLCISSSVLNLQHEVVILSAAAHNGARPWGLIDLASVHVFLKAHTFQPHAGDFFKRQEMSFSDLLWSIDGRLKEEQWPALMDYPHPKDLKPRLNGLGWRETHFVLLINVCKSKMSSSHLPFETKLQVQQTCDVLCGKYDDLTS